MCHRTSSAAERPAPFMWLVVDVGGRFRSGPDDYLSHGAGAQRLLRPMVVRCGSPAFCRGESHAVSVLIKQEESMPSRAGALAEQFEAVNAAIRDLVAGCSEQIWHMRCPGEEWPIGVVAHHIALTQPAFLNLLTILAAGEVLAPRVSIDVVHQR